MIDRLGLALECVWPLQAMLGEGPIWSAADGAVWFVDILQSKIHRFDPTNGGTRTWTTPSLPGFILPAKMGGWIVGLQNQVSLFDPGTGVFEPLVEVEPNEQGNRINDGYVDQKGRLWFGTLNLAENLATGALYRLKNQGLVRCDSGYIVTNGPAMSPDGSILYHTDTLARTIFAFDVDSTGGVSGKRPFIVVEDGAGYPDGMAVDSTGCLWIGMWAGSAIRCYSPAGELIGAVGFPCANVTKLAFGGPDLKTVYATTARKGLSADALAIQPLAGGLFRFEIDQPGLPQYEISHA